MVVFIMHFSWSSGSRIGTIRMGVDPDHLQVRVDLLHASDSCSANRVVSSDCQQNIFTFLLSYTCDFIMKAAKQRAKDVEVPYCEVDGRMQTFLVFNFNVPVVNNLSPIIFLKHLEGAGLSDEAGSLLDATYWLSLRDGCSEVCQFLDDGCSGCHTFFEILYKITNIYQFYSVQTYMNTEEETVMSGPRKTLSVIVLTDNSHPANPEKAQSAILNDKNHIDFRSSAFKETQVDPLQFPKNDFNSLKDDQLIAELNRRISNLESRVQALESKESQNIDEMSEVPKNRRHKVRRRNFQMKRDRMCTHCGKNYGTDTALKYHIKLKHPQKAESEQGSNV